MLNFKDTTQQIDITFLKPPLYGSTFGASTRNDCEVNCMNAGSGSHGDGVRDGLKMPDSNCLGELASTIEHLSWQKNHILQA